MYTFESRIRYSEVDKDGVLPFPGIINYFQDCSVFQSEDLGVGVSYLTSKNRAWMLSSWQVIFNRFPKENEHIKVSTWASGFRLFHGERNFTMKDTHDEMIAYANSNWVYIDLVTGKPTKASKEEVAIYQPEPAIDMNNAPRKIQLPKEGWMDQNPIVVPKSWIDSNNHVNNNQYVKTAWNVLPENLKVHQVRVEYKQAASLGDVIIPSILKEDERTIVMLNNEEFKPYAVVEII